MAATSLIEKANGATVTLQGDAELTGETYVDVEWTIGGIDSNWLVGRVK
jgi:hypothetical protein